MKIIPVLCVSLTTLCLSAPLNAGEIKSVVVDEALQAETIARLGDANGIALACDKKEIAARIKQIMIDNAPKTPANGLTFEESTQKGFLSVTSSTSSQPCSTAETLDDTVGQIERDLPVIFPKNPVAPASSAAK